MNPFERIRWTVHAQVRMRVGKRIVWAKMEIPALSADLAMAFAGAISTGRGLRRVAVEAATVATEHVVGTTWTRFKGRKR